MLTFIFSLPVLATASSANYKLVLGGYDSGTINASSPSYRVLYKTRSVQLVPLSSSSFNLALGFMKGVYFSQQVILAPIVTALSPASGASNSRVKITNLSGANFLPGASVKFSKMGQSDLVATDVLVENSGKISCTLDLTGATPGAWDVTVTNSDGRAGGLPAAFTVTFAEPTLTAITPARGDNDGVVNITNLTGTNFRAGIKVKLSKAGEADLLGGNIVLVSATQLSCQFDLLNRSVGLWDVVVTNDDNQLATLSQAFKVESPNTKIIGQIVSSNNPYNPKLGATSIQYTLSRDTDVTINIFNLRGEKVWERPFPAGQTGGTTGTNSIPWDGLTDFQASASFGVYIVIITARDNGSIRELGRTKIAVVK